MVAREIEKRGDATEKQGARRAKRGKQVSWCKLAAGEPMKDSTETQITREFTEDT